MSRWFVLRRGNGALVLMLAAASLMFSREVSAQLADPSAGIFINEIFFDPPGADDGNDEEFIELRGAPNQSLAGHFLVFLESESEDTGGVDNIFDLGSFSFGSNGFLSLRQANSGIFVPAGTGANNQINTGPGLPPFGTATPGFGSFPGSESASTIGASDDAGGFVGRIENGAFSALLIRDETGRGVDLSDDFDADDDGELDPFVFDNFTILDSVGQSEPGEEGVRFYAAINFASNNNTGATVTTGGQIVNLGFEIEYLGRFGNSTGTTNEDYLVTNVTTDSNSGAGNLPGFDPRVSSSDPQPSAGSGGDSNNDGIVDSPPGQIADGVFIEANLSDIPFGLPILNTLGAPNFRTGDFSQDGIVNAADFTLFRDNFGVIGDQTFFLSSDHNRDFIVDGEDFGLFVGNFNDPTTSSAVAATVSAAQVVPEPHTALLVLAVSPLLASRRLSRR